MDDRRANALSFGHLGEATYDPDQQAWGFSRQISVASSIHPLRAPEEYFAPCAPSESGTSSVIRSGARSRRLSLEEGERDKWLANLVPETGHASAVTSALKRIEAPRSARRARSTILSMGMASDLDHDSGSRQTQIMAMAHGEAGNVLRLVRPRVEKLGWHGKYGTKLRSVNPTSSETGYWTIDGSPIQNIVFASNTEGLTSRLAVQNAEGTSILWPLWHKYPIALPVTTSTGKQIHHSRLNPNPITRLTNSMTGGRPHTDVSFNPWYTRQVAVVDESGYWTTWEIESKKKKRHVVKVDPKSFGHVVDGLSADVEPKIYQSVDGWHRVMWAAELNTIVVCGRHHLSVFDIKDTSKRLPTPSLVRPNSRDCILDMKRDPNNFDQIYVLTNREIFWLQIVPAADKNLEDPSDHVGARILLSCRHYRGEDDLTGRIEVFGENGEDGSSLVLLSSTLSHFVHTFQFSSAIEGLEQRHVAQDSFQLTTPSEDESFTASDPIMSLCLLPTSFLEHSLNPMSGLAKDYANLNIRFYQLFYLTAGLGLYHSMCATKRLVPEHGLEALRYKPVVAPTTRGTTNVKIRSAQRVLDDEFIVPDDWNSEDENEPKGFHTTDVAAIGSVRQRTEPTGALDARLVYSAINHARSGEANRSMTSDTVSDFVDKVREHLQNHKEGGSKTYFLLSDLGGFAPPSEDIDQSSVPLQDLLLSLNLHDDGGPTSAFKTVQLLETQPDGDLAKTIAELSDLYDRAMELWVSDLPQEVLAPTRHAMVRLARDIAIEVYLNSIVISSSDTGFPTAEVAVPSGGHQFVLPMRGKPRSRSVSRNGSRNGSRAASPERRRATIHPGSNLPSLASSPAPSEREQLSQSMEPEEDQAILRLRPYAVPISSAKSLGAAKASILAHWPSTSGTDPSTYSWEAAKAAKDIQSGLDDDDPLAGVEGWRKDTVYRRRSVNRRRTMAAAGASQPEPSVPFGSQPALAAHTFSSQPDSLAMTQPTGGTFGSRTGFKGMRKKRVSGF